MSLLDKLLSFEMNMCKIPTSLTTRTEEQDSQNQLCICSNHLRTSGCPQRVESPSLTQSSLQFSPLRNIFSRTHLESLSKVRNDQSKENYVFASREIIWHVLLFQGHSHLLAIQSSSHLFLFSLRSLSLFFCIHSFHFNIFITLRTPSFCTLSILCTLSLNRPTLRLTERLEYFHALNGGGRTTPMGIRSI